MKIGRLFLVLDISASGLKGQRKNIEARASNIANYESIDAETGKPYQKRDVEFRAVKMRNGFRNMFSKTRLKLATRSYRHLDSLRDRKSVV